MSWAFFWVPAAHPKSAQDELNAFGRAHRVVTVDKQFVADGAHSAWAVAVEVLEAAPPTAATPKGKVDYRDILDAETFTVFASLRTLRKQLADGEGVPAYAIITNEQLAELARLRPRTRDGLKSISGFGEARIRKCGEAFIECLATAQPEHKHAT